MEKKKTARKSLKSVDLEGALKVRSGVRAGTETVQLHGSDFNAAKGANNGEGWQYSDRTRG